MPGFSLQHTLPNQPEIVYESLLDFKKFGEIHPYMTQVSIVRNNLPEYIEYNIVEEVYLFGFIKNHPTYNAKVMEVEKNKQIRYTSQVKKNIFLTVDITFSKNKKGTLIVTETFDIRCNRLMGIIFSDILKKAHLKLFENLKRFYITAWKNFIQINMADDLNYLDKNKDSWNRRTDYHIDSAFYDVKGFLAGNTSLKFVELNLLGDIRNKSILHLQCHFGQDTLSLTRLGAEVTGVDFSDNAIKNANLLAEKTNLKAEFICCDIYSLPEHLDKQFDIVFTSYGTIGWLPDVDKWAKIVSRYLKSGGKFIFVDFHPFVWMYDDNFEKIVYNYFNVAPIIETESGTYADRNAPINKEYVGWNHPTSEVLNSLLKNGLTLISYDEFNYSPYNCFNHTEEFEPGKFRIKHLGDKIPMLFAIVAAKEQYL